MLLAWLTDTAPSAAALILLLALLADAVAGDPPWLYRALPHPVAALGKLIDKWEQRLNRQDLDGEWRYRNGLLLVLALVGLAAVLGLLLELLTTFLPLGWLLAALLASTLLSGRGLEEAVSDVAAALETGLESGRAAVSKIVGRDPESLDEAGVARAAAESLAENYSDGLVAPAFWFLVAGLPGIAAYKAINTLDSMIGHRNARYRDFGRAAAILDDWANFIPARIAGALLCAAAAFHPEGDARLAWRAMLNDAPRHRSPNAGWQEAALAGALGFALAGPRRYGEDVVDDAWMGDGRRGLTASDLRSAIQLYRISVLLLALLVAVLFGLTALGF